MGEDERGIRPRVKQGCRRRSAEIVFILPGLGNGASKYMYEIYGYVYCSSRSNGRRDDVNAVDKALRYQWTDV